MRFRHFSYLRARLRRDGQDFERGLTLIELLIVVTILPLVIGAISVGLLSVLSLQSSVTNRVLGSGDAQVVSSIFVKDVESAKSITTQGLPSSPGNCFSGTQLLGLQWNAGSSVVSYDVTTSSTTDSLWRYYWNGATCVNTLLSTNLSTPPSPSPPTFGCAPSCNQSTWLAASSISSVSWTITEAFTHPVSNYSFTLYATPRVTPAYTTSGRGFLPFTLLGTSTCPSSTPVLSIGLGTLSINVGGGTGNGILGVNSSCPNSVKISNGGALDASTVVTPNPTLNSIQNNPQASYPPTEYPAPVISDPFSSLGEPSDPTSGTTVTCSNPSGNTYNCPAGNYVVQPPFAANGSTITFAGGATTTWFEAGLVIPNNALVVFNSGIYIFGGTTSGTIGLANSLISAPGATITGNNVLFDVQSGAATFGNNSLINFTGQSTYSGVTVWDSAAVATTNPLTLGNNGTSPGYGGIYVPKGEVVDNNNGTLTCSFIIAFMASFSNGLNVNITYL